MDGIDHLDRERHLIARAMAGDLRAYAALVKAYEERMFFTAYRILHSREDAEDCVQETFVRAWEHISGLSDSRAFSTWIYRILSNLADRYPEALEKNVGERRIQAVDMQSL